MISNIHRRALNFDNLLSGPEVYQERWGICMIQKLSFNLTGGHISTDKVEVSRLCCLWAHQLLGYLGTRVLWSLPHLI